MKVLGYTEEVTVCDCCGKSNLKGSFGVETEAGEVLYYGSVCVNRVYGRKRGEAIKSEAQHKSRLQAASWDRAIDLYSRGFFPNYIGAKMGDRSTSNNSKVQMDAVTRFVDCRTGETLRERA